MTILFGWNRFRLKSFTFQELNLPELEQFPNATFQVAQSYFHLFYIPVFPMGKRYDLVMDKQLYHVPPSLMKMVDPEQIKVRGKWYAWLLPILIILIASGVSVTKAFKKNEQEKMSMELAQMQKDFFNDPFEGDVIEFSNHDDLTFNAEIFSVNKGEVLLMVDLLHIQDEEVLDKAERGETRLSADSLQALMDERDALENNSRFSDSLIQEYPDNPILRKLITFELEGYPIRYEWVKMPVKEYKALQNSLGDGITKKAKKIKIPAFHKITKQALFVSPY